MYLWPLLEKSIPSNAPPLLSECDESDVSAYIDVLWKIRRVSLCLEFDRNVSACRAPQILGSLCDSFRIMSSNRSNREQYTAGLYDARTSNASNVKKWYTCRSRLADDEDARKIALYLSKTIEFRMEHLLSPVLPADVSVDLDGRLKREKK